MTTKGKLFKAYAELIAYQNGFASNKMTYVEPDILIGIDCEEGEKLRKELIDAGYLREYTSTRRINHGWYSHRGTYGVTWTGLTAKGWEVAPKYLGIMSKAEAELELKNDYVLANAGTDCVSDFSEYRQEYINARKAGWWLL